MDNIFLWAQLVGIAAMVGEVSSWQLNSSRKIILTYIPVNILWGVQYLMLGAAMGALINFMGALKSIGLLAAKKSLLPWVIFLHLAAVWGFGLYHFQHWHDVLPMMATTIVNVALIDRDNRALIARAVIIMCLLWLVYDCIFQSWMAALCSLLIIVSSVVGMARHEQWNLGTCYKSFTLNVTRSLFAFPGFLRI